MANYGVVGDSIGNGIGKVSGAQDYANSTRIGSGLVSSTSDATTSARIKALPTNSDGTVVSLGANDARYMRTSDTYQHVQQVLGENCDVPKLSQQAYKEMVSKRIQEIIKHTGNNNVVLVLLEHNGDVKGFGTDAQIEQTNQALIAAANENGISYCQPKGHENRGDIHYDDAGYKSVFDQATEVLQTHKSTSRNMPPATVAAPIDPNAAGTPPGPIENSNQPPGNTPPPPADQEQQRRRTTTTQQTAPANNPSKDPMEALFQQNPLLAIVIGLLKAAMSDQTKPVESNDNNPTRHGERIAAAGGKVTTGESNAIATYGGTPAPANHRS